MLVQSRQYSKRPSSLVLLQVLVSPAHHRGRQNVLSFEIFGYDFIIDNNFKPWILEINNNPGLGISSPVIEKLVPRMMDDALRLTIDKVFETKYDKSCIDKENNQYISRFKLDGFNDDENVFEFLCNINNSN